MKTEVQIRKMLEKEEAFFARLQQTAKDEPVFRIATEIREQAALVKRRIDFLKEILE